MLIVFYRQNVSSRSNNVGDYGYVRKLTLSISSVGVNDFGVFTCQAENAFGKSKATVTLNVLGKYFLEKCYVFKRYRNFPTSTFKTLTNRGLFY